HLKRSAYIILARLQNKERAKSGNKTVRAGTADEGSAGNRQAIVLDGVEHAQPGIRAIARQQDHFHARITGQLAVQRQQLLDQWKRITRWQRLDRKSTRLNSSHGKTSYAVFCLRKKMRLT